MDDARERTESLYRAYGPAIHEYLRRRLDDADVALDLLQETFLQAMRRPERLAGAVSPRAWLFGIARNLWRNSLRRRRPMAEIGRSPDGRGRAGRSAPHTNA